MGCGKIKEVQLVNNEIPKEINHQPLIEENIENKKSEIIVKILKKEQSFVEIGKKPEDLKKKESFEEIGKEGEDFEAGTFEQGKKCEESFDKIIKKYPLPKKLPPINNRPIPSTLQPKFTKHIHIDVPKQKIIELSVSDDNQGFNFDYLNIKDSCSMDHEKLIKNIMEELSIKK